MRVEKTVRLNSRRKFNATLASIMPVFSKKKASKIPQPASLIGMLASEKENRLKSEQLLVKERANMESNKNALALKEEEGRGEIKRLRGEVGRLEKELDVMRRMVNGLREEKNETKKEVEEARVKVSKLESKLGLSLGNTGLGKMNMTLRREVKKLGTEIKGLKQTCIMKDDELVKAASEINVLSKALEIQQNGLDEYSNGRKVGVREGLLYQLSLRKEECHNLALELAERSKRARQSDKEIGRLMNERGEMEKELESAEAHVVTLTEQLVEYDSSINAMKAELESKRMDISELLGFVEKISADNSSNTRKIENLRSENDVLRVKLEDAVKAQGDSALGLRERIAELEDQLTRKIALHKVSEERLREERDSGRILKEKLALAQEERAKFDSLRDDLGVIQKGLRSESELREKGERENTELKGTIAVLKEKGDEMGREIEVLREERERAVKERDAALQNVVEMGAGLGGERGIERETKNRLMLQHTLMEQLHHERNLRKLAEEKSLQLLGQLED